VILTFYFFEEEPLDSFLEEEVVLDFSEEELLGFPDEELPDCSFLDELSVVVILIYFK